MRTKVTRQKLRETFVKFGKDLGLPTKNAKAFAKESMELVDKVGKKDKSASRRRATK